jgi:hypothetical protein
VLIPGSSRSCSVKCSCRDLCRLSLNLCCWQGEYVLGFRWDCESTAQVWQSVSRRPASRSSDDERHMLSVTDSAVHGSVRM